jgi:hypothetical protein
MRGGPTCFEPRYAKSTKSTWEQNDDKDNKGVGRFVYSDVDIAGYARGERGVVDE